MATKNPVLVKVYRYDENKYFKVEGCKSVFVEIGSYIFENYLKAMDWQDETDEYCVEIFEIEGDKLSLCESNVGGWRSAIVSLGYPPHDMR